MLYGYGTAAYSVCTKMPWYNEASEVEYDPDEAGRLLDEAGWIMGEDGFREKDGVRAGFPLSIPPGIPSARPCRRIRPTSCGSWGLT